MKEKAIKEGIRLGKKRRNCWSQLNAVNLTVTVQLIRFRHAANGKTGCGGELLEVSQSDVCGVKVEINVFLK